jgi:hypothetical protein
MIEQTCHHLAAFGLAIESDLPLPGSRPEPSAGGSAMPATRVRAASADELDGLWGQSARRVLEPPEDHDGPGYSIDLGEAGFYFWLEGRGRYLVSLDGSTILCEAGKDQPAPRERFLIAHLLPVAALMHGHEVLHASAVRGGPRGAAALTGVSGSGKTTLAGHLIAQGAGFLADDVLAVRAQDSSVLAYPGPALMAVREGELAAIVASGALGATVGRTDKLHLAPAVDPGPCELRAIYHLERGERFRIVEVAASEAGRSLGAAFATYVMTPGRLRGHLAMSRLISAEVAQFRVISPRAGASTVMLDALGDHVAEACR